MNAAQAASGAIGGVSASLSAAMAGALGQELPALALAAFAAGTVSSAIAYPFLLRWYARAENHVRLQRAINDVDCLAAQRRRLAELGLTPEDLAGSSYEPPPYPAPSQLQKPNAA